MRKKYVAAMLAAVFLAGCAGGQTETSTPPKSIQTDLAGCGLTMAESAVAEDFYRLTELKPANNLRYQYQLLDKNGEVVFEDSTFRLPPSFSFAEDHILCVHIDAGTGVYFERYFDVSNNRVSEAFNTPYLAYENMVASVCYVAAEHSFYLIVQNMFDQSKRYLYQRLDLADTVTADGAVEKLVFLQGNHVLIKYEDSTGSMKEETFLLC